MPTSFIRRSRAGSTGSLFRRCAPSAAVGLTIAVASSVALGGAASATATTPTMAATAAVRAATAPGTTYTIGPGSNAQTRMQDAMAKLRPGDTLKVLPGTYGMDLRPDLRLAKGTQASRITVTAADPARPPLFLGAVNFSGADWWQLSHLRIQGNFSRRDSLTMNSGTGWTATDLEVFGAKQTGAYSNVNIARFNGWPNASRYIFAFNCVHDAGVEPTRAGSMHEIYVTALGDNGNALIARNTLFNTPQGAAIKIGNGGVADTPGPQKVQIANNTMFYNGTQVLMFARITDNIVRGNLLVGSTRKLSNGDSVGVYLAALTRGATGTQANLIQQNYSSNLTRPLFDNGSQSGTFTNGGDNNVSPGPGFTSGGCGGLRPSDAHAQLYGRYASRSLYTMP
jgi:hypothetical protein